MKITEDDRKVVCKLYKEGKTCRAIGKIYGVTGTAISNIVHNKYPALVHNWFESAKEKRLRNYYEFYDRKAEWYRKQYENEVNRRLQYEINFAVCRDRH